MGPGAPSAPDGSAPGKLRLRRGARGALRGAARGPGSSVAHAGPAGPCTDLSARLGSRLPLSVAVCVQGGTREAVGTDRDPWQGRVRGGSSRRGQHRRYAEKWTRAQSRERTPADAGAVTLWCHTGTEGGTPSPGPGRKRGGAVCAPPPAPPRACPRPCLELPWSRRPHVGVR